MYGGASKLGGAGRGSGRGGPGIRLSSTYPPPHRLSNSSSSRLSLGGSSSNPRNRSGPPSNAVEETFSLVPGNDPPAFAMIIKLTPDLVDEIKKAEAQGRSARIKFDPIATNADGNLIDVGDKEFKFTWSREFGDLCDIYEERRNGEDGNGLLVETGSAWRKVNVQRILDESTKQQVKMRSEEADRKHKSRKAIVLEHGNPSMKSQLKQLQAAESNPWRQFKNKKEPPFKKRKFEPPQAGGSNKSSAKSVIASSANVKTRHSSSPVPSPSEQIGAPTSPLRGGTIVKPSHLKSQENACESGKNITPKPSSAVAETSGRKGDFRAETMDLQNKLISLLTEKPGMSLKALEKAIGDTTPNAAKKIEPILRKIANLQPPGKYFLKTGPGTDSSKKVSLDSRSSPEDNHMQKLAPPEDHVQRPASEPRFSDNSPVIGRHKEEQSKSKVGEYFDTTEKIDIEQHSPDHFGEKKVSDNSEGKAGSSSDSGTDSDSESVSSGSDTDSGSHSRSRSRSPVGTGSSSSSDSDSDASSNSKQGSDEDVDIMTSDDEKEPQHAVQASEPNFKGSPDPWNAVQNGTDEKHDGDGSDAVDIEGLGSDAVDIEDHRSDAVDIETHESDAAGMETHESDAVDVEKPLVDSEQGINVTANDSLGFGRKDAIDFSEPFHPDHDVIQDRQAFIGNLFEDNDNDNLRHDQSDTSERISQGKPKKHSKKNSDQKPNRHKRAKPENYAKVPVSGGKDAQLAESPNDRQSEDIDKGTKFHKTDEEENADYGSQKGYGQSFSARPNLDNHHPGQKLTDQSARGHDISGRFKHLEPLGHGDNKFLEKDSLGKGGFPVQREKGFREPQDEDAFAKEKRMPQNPKEGSAGRRHSAPFASQYSKHGEVVGKVNDVVQVSKSGMVSPPKDRGRVESITNSVVNEKNLQRELSDLELGELREPLTEDAPMKRQIERKGSFKLSESRTSISDNNSNVDFRKRKSAVKTTDMQKPSPTVSDGGKRMSEHHVDDSTWSQKAGHSQSRQMSKTDNAELEPQFSKLPDAENRLRLEEAGPNVGNNLEGYGESHKKVPTSSQGQDAKRGPSSQLARERKTKSSSTKADMIDGQKDKTLKESSKKARRRREVSTEEEDMSYYKYEKDEPDLKGPIKDFSQYKEYVLEYREKYDRYCSLNKILEKYRDEFQKYAKDLDSAKGRDADKYNKIVRKLKESYRQCGVRHKRLKKIFIILHEELKTIKQRIKDYANSTRD